MAVGHHRDIINEGHVLHVYINRGKKKKYANVRLFLTHKGYVFSVFDERFELLWGPQQRSL